MKTVEERFWNKVQPEPNSGCWLWDAGLMTKGYGQFWDDKKHTLAHRFSYEMLKGPIPEGLQIDHLCRVRSCVNPSHLETVTCGENIRRGDIGKKQRETTHCPKGHEYTAENTYHPPPWGRWQGQRRRCRECARIASRNYKRYRKKMDGSVERRE